MKKILMSSIAVLTVGSVMMAPSLAGAQSWHSHRQDQKEQWKNLAIGAGAIGLLGLLGHNDTVTAIGAAGALYSGYRYSQDGQNSDRYDNYNRGGDRNWSNDRGNSRNWNNDRGNSRNWDRGQSNGRQSRRHGW